MARTEPVTLLCHSPETAARIAATGRNEARLPGVDLPDGLRATADRVAIGEARDLVIVAVPSAHVRSTMTTLAGVLPPSADVLSVVKGLERGTLLRMSEVIAEAGGMAAERVAALSGPNLAAEVARNLPASAVVAAPDIALAERIVERVGRRRFRLYVNADLLGVELAGALKNVIAIAAGAADGLGFGDNGKAGLLTRGLAEMMRVGIAAGADPLTFAGLAGMGDLIATCGRPCRATTDSGSSSPAAEPGPRSRPPCRAPQRALTRSKPPSAWPTGWAWTRPSPGRSTAPCSRARTSSAAWWTCSPASRPRNWRARGSGAASGARLRSLSGRGAVW